GRVRKGRPGPGYICTRQPGPYLTAVKVYPRYSISFAPVSDMASRAHFDECCHADVGRSAYVIQNSALLQLANLAIPRPQPLAPLPPANGQSGRTPFRQR